MTRIYFKPQGPSIRNSKARKPVQMKEAHVLPQPPKDEAAAGKLEPSAIEQIADGLEKMVLSWTHPGKAASGGAGKGSDNNDHDDDDDDDGDGDDDGPVTDEIFAAQRSRKHTGMLANGEYSATIGTTETTISFIHNPHQHLDAHGRLINHASDPVPGLPDMHAVHEIMRQEVLKSGTCLAIQNGEHDFVDYHHMGPASADSALWYLAPSLAVPNSSNSSKEYVKVQQMCREFSASAINDGEFYGSSALQHVSSECIKENDVWEPRSKFPEHTNGGGTVENWQHRGVVSENMACKIEMNGSQSWSETIEISGGNKIRELLGRKLAGLESDYLCPQGRDNLGPEYYKKKVEELQIALLECAMEYEVKIVEMKMKTLQSKPQNDTKRQQFDKGRADTGEELDICNKEKEAQRVEYLRRQLSRLQKEKAGAVKELNDLRKRERQFDLQRRSLDDALNRVNFLQSELARKDQEIVDCQLKEKEAKAQLYELQVALQKAQAAQIEPRKLLTLLPTLKEWIQLSKKQAQPEPIRVDHQYQPDHVPPIDDIVFAITKEIQMLQNALSHVSGRT